MFKLTVYYNKKQKRLVQIQGSPSIGSDLLPLFTSEGDMPKASMDSCNAFCSGFIARGYNTEVINDIKEFGTVTIVNAQKVELAKEKDEDEDEEEEEEEEDEDDVENDEEKESDDEEKLHLKNLTNDTKDLNEDNVEKIRTNQIPNLIIYKE